MKKTIKRIGVLSVSLLTLAASVNAQWTENATSVYLTNGAKKVGIGTPAPSYPLDIKQAANCSFRIQSITSGSANLILSRSAAAGNNCLVNYKTGATDLWYTGVAGTNNDFRIRNAAGTDHLFISQTTGNVGIGTTAPNYKLDVAGDVSINSNKLIVGNSSNYVQYDGGNLPRIMGFNGGILGGTGPDVDIIRWKWNGSTPSVDINGAVSMNSTLGVTGDATLSSNLNVAGNVGIKTTTPLRNVHIVHDQFTAPGGLGGVMIENLSNAAQWTLYSSQSTSGLKLYFGNTELGSFNSTTGVYSAISDARLKKNIEPLENMMDKIMELKPCKYEFNHNKVAGEKSLGLIAQELQKVFPEVVTVNKDDTGQNGPDLLTVNYSGLIPVLIQGMKEMNNKNLELEKQVADMNDCIQSLCNSNTSKVGTSDNNTTQLFQNSPNPFNQTTVIKFALNSENKNGKIIIRDLNGNLVKQIIIANTGKGQVTISANELTQGTYTYTLDIAGVSVDTKLMVVTK